MSEPLRKFQPSILPLVVFGTLWFSVSRIASTQTHDRAGFRTLRQFLPEVMPSYWRGHREVLTRSVGAPMPIVAMGVEFVVGSRLQDRSLKP